MKIINAAAEFEQEAHHNCSDHNHSHEEILNDGQGPIDNPAANFSKYHAEFGYEPMQASELKAPEVPEIKVNGVLIDEPSVLSEMQFHPAENKRAAMIKAAEALIVGELLKQKAIELNLIPKDAGANSVEEAAGLKALIQQQVEVPRASEEECQRFFEANQTKFTTSPLLEVRHILLAAAPEDITERMNLKEVADKLIEILKVEPSAFDDLVARHSACPSKEQKGNLGQISKDQTVPEFEKHVFASEEGLIEFPIETRYGFHIVIIDRKVDGRALPYDYVKDKVEEYLNDKVQRKATAQYIQTLIEEADITGFTFDIEPGVMQ